MSFPAFIPENVIVTTISVKTQMKPVLVWRIPFFLLNILKSPEPTTNMVKHAIQYNFHMVFMKYMAYFGEIIVSSKAAVYLFKIPCIISVIVGFEDWI